VFQSRKQFAASPVNYRLQALVHMPGRQEMLDVREASPSPHVPDQDPAFALWSFLI
jgi:hypothetical protein